MHYIHVGESQKRALDHAELESLQLPKLFFFFFLSMQLLILHSMRIETRLILCAETNV